MATDDGCAHVGGTCLRELSASCPLGLARLEAPVLPADERRPAFPGVCESRPSFGRKRVNKGVGGTQTAWKKARTNGSRGPRRTWSTAVPNTQAWALGVQLVRDDKKNGPTSGPYRRLIAMESMCNMLLCFVHRQCPSTPTGCVRNAGLPSLRPRCGSRMSIARGIVINIQMPSDGLHKL